LYLRKKCVLKCEEGFNSRLLNMLLTEASPTTTFTLYMMCTPEKIYSGKTPKIKSLVRESANQCSSFS
jgi:hypothetical protein